jgi:hypothetical protein
MLSSLIFNSLFTLRNFNIVTIQMQGVSLIARWLFSILILKCQRKRILWVLLSKGMDRSGLWLTPLYLNIFLPQQNYPNYK